MPFWGRCFVVEYNSDGSLHNFFTYDGFSTNSTWARGQAWGIYGFTMAYRYTGSTAFLSTAEKLANYFPPDYVPYGISILRPPTLLTGIRRRLRSPPPGCWN